MRYEYYIVTIGQGDSLIDILNNKGGEGWRLASTIKYDDYNSVKLIFERQI